MFGRIRANSSERAHGAGAGADRGGQSAPDTSGFACVATQAPQARARRVGLAIIIVLYPLFK